jgi:hypothetical protein
MQERPARAPALARRLKPPGLFSLTLPFAIVGLVGGWLAVDVFGVHGRNQVCWLLLTFTPLVSAALGRFLSPRIRSGLFTTGMLVIASICIAGMINGLLIALVGLPPQGAILGGPMIGLICSFPFIPALCAVAFVARRVGRARVGSIVDRADRRAVFCATGAVSSLAFLFTSQIPLGSGTFIITPSLALAVCALLLLAIDVRALLGACAALKESVAVTLADAPATPAPEKRGPRATVVDFGLGDEEVEEVAHEGAAYREQKRTLRVFRGSAEQAQDALAWMIAADVTALVLACLSLLSRMASGASVPAFESLSGF